jgi:hypothetical protein
MPPLFCTPFHSASLEQQQICHASLAKASDIEDLVQKNRLKTRFTYT